MKDYLRIRMFRLFIYPFRIISIRNGVRAAFTVGMIFPPEVGGRQDRLYIHGSKGTISSDVEYNQAGDLCYTITSEGKETLRKISARQNYTLETEQLGRYLMHSLSR